MFDFAVSTRHEGGMPGRNDKGLVTYDRKTKKDAFYFYKANWSDEAGALHHQPPFHRTHERRDGRENLFQRQQGGIAAERKITGRTQ